MADFNNLTPDEKDSLRSMNIKRVILVKRLISAPMIMLGFIAIYLGIEASIAVNEFSLFSIVMAILAGLTWPGWSSRIYRSV